MLYGLGWSIIPIRPSPGGDHKSPAVRSWKPYQRRPMPLRSLVATIEGAADCVGIAIVLGAASGGLMVRDFDTADGYHAWAAREPRLASILPTVRTGKGYHVYARTASPIATRVFHGPGEPEPGELRGEGSYVVTAPSLHSSGIRYSWTIPPGGPIPVIDPAILAPEGYAAPDALPDKRKNAGVVHKTFGPVYQGGGREGFPPSCVPGGGGWDPDGDKPRDVDPEEADIRRSLPGRAGERNTRLFDYLRRLKARHPEIGLEELEPRVMSWHRAAYPEIRTKPFEETWADARRMWPRIEKPKGLDLRERIEAARSLPGSDGLPGESGILLNLCGLLADAEGAFFLSVSTARAALGMGEDPASRMTAWRRREGLIIRGLIEKTAAGTYAGMKADEFRLTPEGRKLLRLASGPAVAGRDGPEAP